MNTNSVPGGISGIIQSVDGWIDSLNGYPAWLIVAVGCLILGFSLKRWTQFPNNLIPLAVVAFGGLFYAFMAPDHPANIPVHRWKAQCFIAGMGIGFVVWLFHNKIWKMAVVRFPILGAVASFNTEQFKNPNPAGGDNALQAQPVPLKSSEQSDKPSTK